MEDYIALVIGHCPSEFYLLHDQRFFYYRTCMRMILLCSWSNFGLDRGH
jgi:hypothetical protein